MNVLQESVVYIPIVKCRVYGNLQAVGCVWRKKSNMSYIWVFLSAFIQIGLVAFQTLQIAQVEEIKYASLRIFLVSITISIVWLFNINNGVKKCLKTKLSYLLGTGWGAVAGANFSGWIS